MGHYSETHAEGNNLCAMIGVSYGREKNNEKWGYLKSLKASIQKCHMSLLLTGYWLKQIAWPSPGKGVHSSHRGGSNYLEIIIHLP